MRAQDCADFIVSESLDRHLEITNLQLQKILYLLVCVYNGEIMSGDYTSNDLALEEDRFEGWDYGPVQINVYHDYSGYMSNPITRVCQHEKFNIETLNFDPNPFDRNNILPRFRELVNRYLERLLNCNIFDIVNYTHTEPFWRDHRTEIIDRERPMYPINIHMSDDELENLLAGWEHNG